MQPVEHARQPRPRLARGAAAPVRLGDDGDEQVPTLVRGLRLEVLEQLLAAGGLVGEHERDLERQALVLEVDDDVLYRQPGGVLDALDQVPPQPARVQGRVSGEDDRVGPVRGDGVHRRHEGVGVADLPGGLDALGRDRREGEVDAHLRRFAHRLVVDHKARRGLGLRHDQAEADVAGCGTLAHRIEQLCATERAVGDHEDFLHRFCLLLIGWVPARCPSRLRPWRGPAARRCRGPRRGRRTRMDRPRPSGRGRS